MSECILETPKMIVLQAQLGDWDNLNHLLVCKKKLNLHRINKIGLEPQNLI